MALLFGTAGSDRVEVADSSSLRNLTAATYLCWAYVTSTANSRFCQKGTAVAVNYRSFGVTSAELTAQVYRPTTTTNATAALTNFAAWGTSKWCFVAGVHDTAGANGDQKLYIGDLTTLAAEPSSYSVQVVGSGAVGDNTGAIQYIAVTGAATLSLPGRIAVMQIYNRVLTVAEIRSLQFRPRALSGCVGYWIFGGTTGTQADYSGNGNAGTVTGATVADHVPLPPAFSYDDSLETPVYTGTGAIAVPQPVIAGTAALTFTGTAAAAVSQPVIAATGSSLLAITSTGALAVPQATLAATGAETFTGSCAPAVPAPSLALTGSALLAITGTAVLAIAQPTLAATGTFVVPVTGTAAAAVPQPAVSATAAETFTGTAAVASGTPVIGASGDLPLAITGTGALAVPAPRLAATGYTGVVAGSLSPAPRLRRVPQAISGTCSLRSATARLAGRARAISAVRGTSALTAPRSHINAAARLSDVYGAIGVPAPALQLASYGALAFEGSATLIGAAASIESMSFDVELDNALERIATRISKLEQRQHDLQALLL